MRARLFAVGIQIASSPRRETAVAVASRPRPSTVPEPLKKPAQGQPHSDTHEGEHGQHEEDVISYPAEQCPLSPKRRHRECASLPEPFDDCSVRDLPKRPLSLIERRILIA